MLTSIIIPIRYRADLTQVCIDSILLYTKDCELILIQEGEDEEITKLLEKYKASNGNVIFTQNKKPKGYSGALNTGIKLAKGDVFCFMNNDTVATPGWMDEMLLALEENKVGLVSPTFWGTGERQSVDWNKGQLFDFINEPLCLMGVCFVVPREVIEDVGEWDEEYNHGGEDFDLTIRIYEAGYRLVIARKSFIYHYGGASTRILFDNSFPKVWQHRIEQINLLIKKRNLNSKDVYERLKIKQ